MWLINHQYPGLFLYFAPRRRRRRRRRICELQGNWDGQGTTHSCIEIIADKDPQHLCQCNAQWHQKQRHYQSLRFNSWWWAWDSLRAEEAHWCGRQSALMHRLDGRWAWRRGGGERSQPMGTCWSKTTVTVSSCENFHSHSTGVSAKKGRLRGLTEGCRSAVIKWQLCADLCKELQVDNGVWPVRRTLMSSTLWSNAHEFGLDPVEILFDFEASRKENVMILETNTQRNNRFCANLLFV